MTILCGTDFSAPSTDATRVAAILSARLAEPLVLVHVMDDPPAAAMLEPERRDVEGFLRLRLRTAVEEARALGAEVSGELVSGSAAEVLARLAGERDASVLVLSAVGRRPPARWLLGSTVERVTRTSTRPVLVVRDAAPFERWSKDGRALEVLACADRSSESDGALRFVGTLHGGGPCNVTVAHVASAVSERERLGIDVADPAELPPEVERAITDELRARARVHGGEADVDVILRSASRRVDEELASLAVERRSDLVVVGAHRRSRIERLWHGSISRGVLHLAPSNVISVPGVATPAAEKPIPTFERVLVATDFSETGNRGVPYAFSLLPNGGTVHLAHVLSSPAGRAPVGEPTEALARLVPLDAGRRGVSAEVHVVAGEVATELCQLAERLDVDVVCIGSHGRSGIAAVVFGSVAREVLAKSRRPVLVVGPREGA